MYIETQRRSARSPPQRASWQLPLRMRSIILCDSVLNLLYLVESEATLTDKDIGI